jgi:hypothetical protein
LWVEYAGVGGELGANVIERPDIPPVPCIASKAGVNEILDFRQTAMPAADYVIYLMGRYMCCRARAFAMIMMCSSCK